MRTSRLATSSVSRHACVICSDALWTPKGVKAASPASTIWRSNRGRCFIAIMYGRMSRELARTDSGPNLAPGRKLHPESKGTPRIAMSMPARLARSMCTSNSSSPPCPSASASRRLLHLPRGSTQIPSLSFPRLPPGGAQDLKTSSSMKPSCSPAVKENVESLPPHSGFRVFSLVGVLHSASPTRTTTWGSSAAPSPPAPVSCKLRAARMRTWMVAPDASRIARISSSWGSLANVEMPLKRGCTATLIWPTTPPSADVQRVTLPIFSEPRGPVEASVGFGIRSGVHSKSPSRPPCSRQG
mmetsp:Transcript_52232/g.146948  ORF Transcript_52232/g.146948 Transcript_52232/m.146948 type:complete len:299 (+) Transcript_52232:659-1555(+)